MKKRPRGKPKLELLGFKTGKLTVIAEANRINGYRAWLCLCECGKKKAFKAHYLHGSKPPRTCGCGKQKWNCMNNYKHGLSHTKEYQVWTQIKQRCYNMNIKAYRYVGAKGITIDDTWHSNFPNFLEDMGNMPSPEYVIERIDDKLNFTKSNCKWRKRK